MIEYSTIVEGEVTQQTIEGQSNIYPNEIDPTVPKHVKNITEEDIKKWNQAGITEVTANDVKFEDGTTFQEKYNSGELKGEPGVQGIRGEPGKDGEPGRDGVDGKDGYTPIKGIDYFDGQPGKNGVDGTNGVDGKTPVKGVDYFTESDKQELVDLVLAEIPSAEGVGY